MERYLRLVKARTGRGGGGGMFHRGGDLAAGAGPVGCKESKRALRGDKEKQRSGGEHRLGCVQKTALCCSGESRSRATGSLGCSVKSRREADESSGLLGDILFTRSASLLRVPLSVWNIVFMFRSSGR